MLPMVIIAILFTIAEVLFVTTLFLKNRVVASGLIIVSALWTFYTSQLLTYKKEIILASIGGCIMFVLGILIWSKKDKLIWICWIIFGLWLVVEWDLGVMRSAILLVTIIGAFVWGKKKKFF
jgi:hypothetical protein